MGEARSLRPAGGGPRLWLMDRGCAVPYRDRKREVYRGAAAELRTIQLGPGAAARSVSIPPAMLLCFSCTARTGERPADLVASTGRPDRQLQINTPYSRCGEGWALLFAGPCRSLGSCFRQSRHQPRRQLDERFVGTVALTWLSALSVHLVWSFNIDANAKRLPIPELGNLLSLTASG